jgi:hypothetical protein
MIDTKELRRLAQAATPGPWINHGRQPNVAGLPHSAVAAKTLLARVYSEAYGDVEQETANASFIAAANPAAISELLDRLEAAEKERDALRAKVETAENDADHQKALAASALRVAEGWERKCGELRAELETERTRLAACGVVALANTPDSAKQAREMRPEYWSASCGDVARMVDENISLRTKIEAMEQQEPVATVRINAINGNPSVDFVPGHHYLHHNDRLYLAPGAQPAPSVPEGWKLVPTAESRHPGIYKMLGALHAIDNTRGASEWESYAAMLAAAPEAKL